MEWEMQLKEAALTDRQAIHLATQLLQREDLEVVARSSIALIDLFDNQPDIARKYIRLKVADLRREWILNVLQQKSSQN